MDNQTDNHAPVDHRKGTLHWVHSKSPEEVALWRQRVGHAIHLAALRRHRQRVQKNASTNGQIKDRFLAVALRRINEQIIELGKHWVSVVTSYYRRRNSWKGNGNG